MQSSIECDRTSFHNCIGSAVAQSPQVLLSSCFQKNDIGGESLALFRRSSSDLLASPYRREDSRWLLVIHCSFCDCRDVRPISQKLTWPLARDPKSYDIQPLLRTWAGVHIPYRSILVIWRCIACTWEGCFARPVCVQHSISSATDLALMSRVDLDACLNHFERFFKLWHIR